MKKYTPKFKAQLVIRAIEGHTLEALSIEFGVNSKEISRWKQRFLSNAHLIFLDRRNTHTKRLFRKAKE
jgi:transposase-like protein